MKAKPTIITFCVLLFGLAAANLFWPDRIMSESENRYLQQNPKFSWDSLASGKYTGEFETYITDQFAWRDGWMAVKTLAEVGIGRRSTNGVYFAKDNTLIEMFDTVDAGAYERNLGYAAEFSKNVEENLGVRVQTMLIPTASAVLRDKLPAFAPEADQRALLQTAADRVPHFVDVTTALSDHRDEYIFYRTDHHWTSLGAYYAYNEWRAQTGLPGVSESDFKRETLSDAFYGTVWSKAQLRTVKPDVMEAWLPETGPLTVEYNMGQLATDTIYERSFLETKDKYSAYLNANQPVVRISTGADNGKRLLLIKDSYANTFAQMTLKDYEEIFLIDLRYYRASAYDFIEANRITDVLILYNLKGFSSDPNLIFLLRPLGPG